MMLILQRYDLKVKYVPGSELSVADALSRAYLEETKESLIPDLEVNEVPLTAHFPISQERYSEFQQATAADPTLQALSTVVRNGWPFHKLSASIGRAEMKFQKLMDYYSKHRSLLFFRVREKKC